MGSGSRGTRADIYHVQGVCTQEEEEDWNEEGYLVGTTHWMSPEVTQFLSINNMFENC